MQRFDQDLNAWEVSQVGRVLNSVVVHVGPLRLAPDFPCLDNLVTFEPPLLFFLPFFTVSCATEPQVSQMNMVFSHAVSFNGNIEDWDVSNVGQPRGFYDMFRNAKVGLRGHVSFICVGHFGCVVGMLAPGAATKACETELE